MPTNYSQPLKSPNKPVTASVSPQSQSHQSKTQSQHPSGEITKTIIQQIDQLTTGFSGYQIRMLVEHAEDFGTYLQQNQLKTNQVRKFLDAVNRIKANLPEDGNFSTIETEIVLLKPKLAYAAARQPSVQALSKVMSAAIDKVHSIQDFDRLAQFLESTIAYHKAAGGRNQ
jgi:CRISPR-associated protein Csm2